MIPIRNSPRIKEIEQKYGQNLKTLFYKWHWDENLKHSEIAERIFVPRPTVTRWFHKFKIPTQSCTRFTNKNLWSYRLDERPKAKPKIKKEFPWKFNKEFFNEWSPEMAYVLGFLFADGYVFKNPRGSCFFCFCSTDREIIRKIRGVLQSNHKIGLKSRNNHNSKWKNSYVLQIGSKEIFKKLKVFGVIPNKSLVIRFPKVPQEFFGDFVRGYFDGDGCVHLGRYWRKDRQKWYWVFSTRFTSGSKRFIDDLSGSLKKYIKGGHIQKKKNNSGYDLQFSIRDSIDLYKLMYNNMSSDLYLSRKYSTFKKAFTTLKINAAVV